MLGPVILFVEYKNDYVFLVIVATDELHICFDPDLFSRKTEKKLIFCATLREKQSLYSLLNFLSKLHFITKLNEGL